MESGVLFIAYIIIFNIPKIVALFDTEVIFFFDKK